MHRKAILIICSLVFLTYFNTLFNKFVGDDHLLLVRNSFYKSWSNFPRLFQEGYNFEWTRDMFSDNRDLGAGSVSYRPVANASYFLGFWMWGLNPFGFHLINVLIHMANVVLVYFLFLTVGFLSPAALFAALLFGLHPVQAEVVCNIGYRADMLACFFVLGAALFWLLFRRETRKVFYWLSLVSYFFAVFSKESAVVFPLALWVYEQFFGTDRGRRRLVFDLYQAGFWLVTAFYLYVYCFVFTNSALPHNQMLDSSWQGHVAIMGQIWVEYIRAMLLPWTAYLLPALYAPSPVLGWNILIPFAVLAGILATAFIYGRRSRVYIFLLAWFFIFYIPVCNIIPLANPMAFRFLYLPSIGFLGAMALLLKAFLSLDALKKISARLKAMLKAFIIVLCMSLTFVLNSLWNNDYLIASTWVRYYPDSWKAYDILGLLYFQKGDYDKAEGYFLKSIQYGGRDADIRIDYYLGMCYLAKGQLDRAQRHFQFALAAFPDFPYACYGMARLLNEKGDYEQALVYYRKAIDSFPSATFYYIEPLELYLKLGRKAEAKELLELARKHVRKERMEQLDKYFSP